MKKGKVIFWTATIIIFLIEGVMPVLTPQTESVKGGVLHLGYPEYFGQVLKIFKVLGAVVLIIPPIPGRIKEWAYAGFTFDLLFACISHYKVDGLGFETFFPLVILIILAISYIYYHKINSSQLNP